MIEHFFLVHATKSIQCLIRLSIMTIHFSELVKLTMRLNSCLLLLCLLTLLLWFRPLYHCTGRSDQFVWLSGMLVHHTCDYSIVLISFSKIRIYTFNGRQRYIIYWILMAYFLMIEILISICLVLLHLIYVMDIFLTDWFFLGRYCSGFCVGYFCESRVILLLPLYFKLLCFSRVFWLKEFAMIFHPVVCSFGFNLVVVFVISLNTFFGSLWIKLITIIIIDILVLYFNLIIICIFVSIRHFLILF